jgi:hypothetical protein
MDWPLRELFINFVERSKRNARDAYEFDFLIWAILKPYQKPGSRWKEPRLPSILKR